MCRALDCSMRMICGQSPLTKKYYSYCKRQDEIRQAKDRETELQSRYGAKVQ